MAPLQTADTARRTAGPESNGADAAWSQPSFGAAVRRLRTERGLSQHELAGAGMSTGYLSRLERGERPPTKHVVEYLAGRLGVPTSSLGEEGARSARGGLGGMLLALDSALSPDGEAALIDELADAVEGDRSVPVELRWQAVWRLSKHHGQQGRYAEELNWLNRLSPLSDEIDDDRLRARTHVQLARCQLVLGQTDLALASAELAYRLVLEHGLVPSDAAEALMVLVSVESECGHTAQAVQYVSVLIEAVAEASPVLRARALWNGAMAYAHAAADDDAKGLMAEALAILDSRDDVILWLRLRIAALSLYLRLDPLDVEMFESLLEEVKAALALVGSERHQQEARLLEARFAVKHGETDRARRLFEVLDTADLMLGFRDTVQLAMLRGQLLIADGRTADGAKVLRDLAEQARAQSNFRLAADIWEALARALV